MKNVISTAGALLISGLIGGHAIAGNSDLCNMSKMNLVIQGPKYEAIVNNIVKLLERENISYIVHGSNCSDTYGGCGGDLFAVGDVLDSRLHDSPAVLVTPKIGATKKEGSFYLFGKLEGLIGHKECGLDDEYINGHAWATSFTQYDLRKYMDSGLKVGTTMNKAGHMVSKGYKSSQYTGYDDGTVIVRDVNFRGNANAFRKFIKLIEEIQVF